MMSMAIVIAFARNENLSEIVQKPAEAYWATQLTSYWNLNNNIKYVDFQPIVRSLKYRLQIAQKIQQYKFIKMNIL